MILDADRIMYMLEATTCRGNADALASHRVSLKENRMVFLKREERFLHICKSCQIAEWLFDCYGSLC